MRNGRSLTAICGKSRLSEAVATLGTVPASPRETTPFQAYRGSEPPRFVNAAERECAQILDWYGIPWDYEPRSFVLERDAEGRITSAFTPKAFTPSARRIFLKPYPSPSSSRELIE